ncbi:MAG: sulfatase, partial [Myxococcota bacterium]|nr:sulfatase [Myxococcota bacterium]
MAGLTWGLWVGTAEVLRQGYLETGLFLNGAITLRTSLDLGLSWGLLLGLSAAAAAWLVPVSRLRPWASGLPLGRIGLGVLLAAILTEACLAARSGNGGAGLTRLVVLSILLAGVGSSSRFRFIRTSALLVLLSGLAISAWVLLEGSRADPLHGTHGSLTLGWLLATLVGAGCLQFGRGHTLAMAAVLFAGIGATTPRMFLQGRDPGDPPIDVVIIAVDTLRWDYTDLPASPGVHADLTPALASLAERGTTFTTAISQAPWTLPAFASILTGQYPSEHGATSFTREPHGILVPGTTTLAEQLREAGYRTGAVVRNGVLSRRRGLAQGVDEFDETPLDGHLEITGAGVTDRALAFLDTEPDAPSFLFLHYMDPHSRYMDHPDWSLVRTDEATLARPGASVGLLRTLRHLLEPADHDLVRDSYAEEVAFTDQQIGRLIEGLEQRNRLDTTAIVVVADHGEELFERGWLGHTISLHEEVIRVPMILWLPGEDTVRTVDEVVETRSLYPTLLDYLGLDQPENVGGSLLPLARGTPGDPPEGIAFSSVWLPDARSTPNSARLCLSAVRNHRWKLVRDHTRGRERLYDLRDDPAELQDARARAPDITRELSDALDQWSRRTGLPTTPEDPGRSDGQETERL